MGMYWIAKTVSDAPADAASGSDPRAPESPFNWRGFPKKDVWIVQIQTQFSVAI